MIDANRELSGHKETSENRVAGKIGDKMGNKYSENRIRAIMARHRAGFSKNLGQNFLTDYTVIEAIAEGAEINEEDHVIEIGPGIGVLTIECADRAGFVSAVEIDKKLIPILEETVRGYDNIEIINRDILKTDIEEICRNAQNNNLNLKRVKIVGNLPYYITTPIIMKLLEENVPAESITIMMQKEVADRLISAPGKKTYGAISLAVQYYCTIDEIIQVPAEAFVPKPKVDSTVLRLNIRKEKPVRLKDEAVFFSVIKAGFSQRRKTLLNCLLGICGMEKGELSEFLENLGIDSKRRAETLDMDEFAEIANALVSKVE